MFFAKERVRKIARSLWPLGVLAVLGGCERLPEIHVIGDRKFPPYETCQPGDDSRAEGITVEQWRFMARRVGLRIKYTCDTWENAQKAVLAGKADAIGGMARGERREKDFQFIRKLVLNPTFFYYRKNSMTDLTFQDIVLEGRAVGVVKGDDSIDTLQKDYPNVRFNYYESYGDVVAAAERKEINAFVMEEAVAVALLNEHRIFQVFTRGTNALFKDYLWSAVRRGNDDLARKLEDGFSKVTDEELQEIERRGAPSHSALSRAIRSLERWIENSPAAAALSAFLLVYVLAICALFVFAPLKLFYISVWLRRIKLQVPNGLLDLAPLRIISLIWVTDTSHRVLNAWLVNRRAVILRNFSRRKTVGARKSHYLMPFVIDGQTIEVPSVQERSHELITRLRSIFETPGACVSIIGEGGSGKTSLACWICRNALQDAADPAEHIFPKLTVPIVLEGQLAQPVVDCIHAQLVSLVEEEVPHEILTALMRKGHILVVVDGLSEFDKASRDRVETIGPTVPRFSLIVTGRRDVPVFGGMAKAELKPLAVSRTVLASFLEFLLREAGADKKLANADFFDGCKHLARLAGDRDISPLLVVLYSTLLAPADSGGAGSTSKVTTIPDIFLEFVNRLNSALKDDPISDATVHRHLRIIAWCCVSKDYRPQPCSRSELLPLVDEAALKYLESRLGLIETIKPTQTHVRFLLDPLAEYLAAAFLCAEGQTTGDFRAFLKFATNQANTELACFGLCQAVVDIAFAKDSISALIAPSDLQALAALGTRLQQQGLIRDNGSAIDPAEMVPSDTNPRSSAEAAPAL